MRLNRADPAINDAIEALDQRLLDAKRRIPKAGIEEQKALAWAIMSPAETSFIFEETAHCIDSRTYYLQNYHVIQTDRGELKCMNPLFDLQLMVEEAIRVSIAETGQSYLVILKPRQSGITEYSNGVMCWRTFFLPNAFTLTVAQDPPTASWVQRKVNIAYDHLPYWLQVERQYFTKGEHMEFGRKDQLSRSSNPGLGTILVTTHALRDTGVAIGKSIRSLHLTEVSRWPSSDLYVSDIKPTMNAPDTIAIAESTAWGSNGFFYNLWQGANDPEDDDGDWKPLFLPGYRDRKNRRLIRPKQQPFVVTDAEKKVTTRVKIEEGFDIPDEFWNFRRRGMKDSIKESGFAYGHLECFPITTREAFQSSGLGAFARHKLDEQEANILKPLWVGEIIFQGRGVVPKVLLESMIAKDGSYRDINLPPRESVGGRLYLWEQPDPSQIYYISGDAGEGIGQDPSVVEILRAGFLNEPDVQVGEWVGYEPPEAFGRIVYAIGYFFNRAEVAIEYNGPGTATADYLMNQLEYPNLYIPRNTDRVRNPFKPFMHWQTTSKTKPLLRAKMNETLLESGIIIHSEYTLAELRACEVEGESFAALEGHDDAAISICIGLYCLRQTMIELRRPVTDGSNLSSAPAARHLHPPVGAVIYGVYDQVFRLRAQKRTLQEAQDIVDKNPGFQIKQISVSKANTAFSVIHHGSGIENELYQGGMIDRDITPQLVTQYGLATGRVYGAASPGADESLWDSSLGDFGE